MNDDTIAAISTSLGEGGIGIVRLSGRDAITISRQLFSSPKGKDHETSGSHRLTYGFVKDPSTGATIDEALVTVMKAPNTYTKEDVVEINCHGGLFAVRKVLELALRLGARLAEPGEFTKRAFLNGRIDLSQAEAVMDIISAKTEEAARIAIEQLSGDVSVKITGLRDRIAAVCAHIEAYIDFPEDEIEPATMDRIVEEVEKIGESLVALSKSFEEGRFFREGLMIAIVGRPNVGKSSLLNALLNRDRAIVTEVAGTTRDVLEEYLNIKGLPARIMDTAGIREAHEMAEREGVMRSLKAIDRADLVIGMIDGTCALHDEDLFVLEKLKAKKGMIVINKSDLPSEEGLEGRLTPFCPNILRISARTGSGLDTLKETVLSLSAVRSRETESRTAADEDQGVIVTNVRHKVAIDKAVHALRNAGSAFAASLPLEIVALEMRDSLDRLGEIVGAVTTEDILNRIFSEFCIGK